MKEYIEPEMKIRLIDFSDIVTASDPKGAETPVVDGNINPDPNAAIDL